jgi:hypothetical protein
MLIYFLIIILGLFISLNFFLKSIISKDLIKFITLVCEIEDESNTIITLLKNFLIKLKVNSLCNQLEFLLLKNLEVKLIKKIKW